MQMLPTSIEKYLEEVGFSSTELLILKKLLEYEALTLREMASRTGKSTGVLDQAAKKLIKRGIVKKMKINNTPKYTLFSVDAVLGWVKRDMRDKRELLKRRESDFESFVSSIQKQSDRPDIEYFEGESGLGKAFERALSYADSELLHYVPVGWKEEEDPLRELRVQFFRARRSKKIFSRVLAPQNPPGKRFQSRDPFEYRSTRLLSEDSFPLAFEKVIAGEVILCLNNEKKKGCLLHYSEFAEAERATFEVLWSTSTENEPVGAVEESQEIATKTRALSALRGFFLSKSNLLFLLGFVLVALLTTIALYYQTLRIVKIEIGEQMKSLAVVSTHLINTDDLEEIQVAGDMDTEEYQRVYSILNTIRNGNTNRITYAYILRPTENPDFFEFVVDADTNFDELEDAVPPGTQYYIPYYYPPYLDNGWKKPIADTDYVSDPWGTYISGNAPIYNKAGEAVAVLGLDAEVSKILKVVQRRFSAYLWFTSSLSILILLRFVFLVKKLK